MDGELAYHELLNSLIISLIFFEVWIHWQMQRRFPLAKFSNIRLLKPTFLQVFCKFCDIGGVEVALILPL